MKELTKAIVLCSACRKAFIGNDAKIGDGCPGCGSKKSRGILQASALVDNCEDAHALHALCQVDAGREEFEEVADIMGIEGGASDIRNNSTQWDGLNRWMRETGI